ncbi:MAG: hypothetical protein IJO98_06070 [Clostridia bacterium]|nr:hypothetical protein [Clostridia bacterium]
MKKRMIAVSLVLVLLLSLLTGCSSKEESAQKSSLHIVVAAPFATEEQASALKDALLAAAPELDSEELPLSVSHIATGDTEKDPYGAMAGMSQITVRLMSDEIELLLCDADNARRHGDNGETYIPLAELLTEEEISELSVVPATIPIIDEAGNLTEERSGACGVDLSENKVLVQMLNIADLGAYIVVDSPNLENAKTALKALLSM